MADIICARCRMFVRDHECQGESGLYSPNRRFMLCEICFDDEDREIDAAGGNDIPNRLAEYKANLRLGPIGRARP